TRRLDEKLPDRNRIRRVIGTLIDDFEYIVRAEDGCGHLYPTGSPAVGHRHFTACKRHLVARNGDGLENGAPDHALGLLVEIRKIVGGRAVHSAASSRT